MKKLSEVQENSESEPGNQINEPKEHFTEQIGASKRTRYCGAGEFSGREEVCMGSTGGREAQTRGE